MRSVKGTARRQICKTEVSIIRVAPYLLALALLAGCTGKKFDSGESTDVEKIEPPTTEVITREVVMEKFDADGTLLWSVAADRAEGELSPEGDYTKVDGVTVVLHDDGKPAFEIG